MTGIIPGTSFDVINDAPVDAEERRFQHEAVLPTDKFAEDDVDVDPVHKNTGNN